MNPELTGVIFTYLLTLAIAIPLGRYIAKVFKGEKTWLDFLAPLDRFIFRFSGIDTKREMNWKQHLLALLTINSVWLIYAFVCLMAQGHLPLNPDANPGQSPDTAFNTAISFLVNCNLQHYSGESGATYFTQHFVFMFLHFVSAATGIAALIVVFRAMKDKVTDKLGNFWEYFVKSITRILLPISFLIAVIFAFNGMTTSYAGKDTFISMQGDTVHVSRGPVAPLVAIKHLGTNGGGWFGANSAHPIENPNYLTNTVELVAQVAIPIALVFALGFYLNKKKFAYVIFGVMTLGMLMLLIPTMNAELNGNPAIAKMGISQPTGAMEGKEVRFGPANSAYWSIVTTIISTGSVNSMHDSAMPVSGTMMLLGMMVNCFYGGCGVGILNFYIFIIVAVFISGLMVGRTPEFLGRKIEAREMKIASLIALLHPFIILVGLAISSYYVVNVAGADWAVKPSAWLNNPGTHGFSEMLYEYTSSAANNGSGFEGLGDGNIFWNYTTGIVMILGRFLPIIGPLAIAGLLANKKYIPESAGTLKSDTSTFGLMIFAVIVIIAALSFFPSLALGPIAEHFSLK
ncbi:potassium-transporting ATPase subunit KdpA [Mucilaginibacter rubeus]|uniref:Potassium-transporting ATPase potassium-binding subunit n=1 Tax=Mucilaginibacter rubeus TaxID=2027860 RepID=A0AAE6JGT9_9SPHI|nr:MULTISPECIES: potassium-transporting ATPase subunit KdpA [Mucilaginibacter]QEM05176.1 potassium-transporting ATPase subunit KdpA [Mucilaginibacter rubeus]QEM17769.1 potassium-transporting ATPase subunit KdpA [Mucilaginibacter gossypii]QTE45704.1 potassium-transporting ATPase subunit KdpA [Mucilaginibacter rubeus]QTE52301.1 potassium-transporting ATPase subunit KdpA [Mucilaginibacter rubeus]QTE57390.1 potassium-transporting ATPase subunit KdpA [Mucilaginibacter rubeus]